MPDAAAIRRAADVLNAGSKVAILVGSGARGARAEVEQVAGRLGAGVAKALLGKDVVSDELPFVTGSIGLLGTRPSYEMMRDCDTLLTIGSSFPYSQFLPEYDQARAVQIDVDPTLVGMRYPYEVNLVGDAAATLQALLPLLRCATTTGWREHHRGQRPRVVADDGGRGSGRGRPGESAAASSPKPAVVCRPTRSWCADSGSSANWYARQLRFRGTMRGSLSGTLATMGAAVGYGIGAKFAFPERPVVVFTGDGAMQMNGLAELLTIKHYLDEWPDRRLIIAVLHNNDLNQVTWEMRAMQGSPKFVESQTLPDVSYADFAAGDRAERDDHHRSGAARGRLGPGALSGSADRSRRALRPGRPADPAACDVRPDEECDGCPPARRRGPLGRHQGGPQDEGAGAHPAARRLSGDLGCGYGVAMTTNPDDDIDADLDKPNAGADMDEARSEEPPTSDDTGDVPPEGGGDAAEMRQFKR